jgi:hypothetical protein
MQLWLGAVDPSVESIFPPVTKTAGFTAKDKDLWEQAVNARFVPAYFKKTAGDCETPTKGSVKGALMASGGGIALKVAGATGPFAPFVLAGGVLLSIFGIFGAHHAAAVAKEQGTLCVAIPAANDSLQQIDDALNSGQLTAAQAAQAYDQVIAAYGDYVKLIIKMTPSQCNAACVYMRMLQGIVAQRKLDVQASPPPADTGVIAGVPSWALFAGAAAALYFLL